jgi:formylglycine-generating enzyme required for sulfatase activity
MKKLLVTAAVLTLLIVTTACGTSSREGEVAETTSAVGPATFTPIPTPAQSPTPTRFAFATPTPLPAPPTPTPILPTSTPVPPTPTPEAQETQAATKEPETPAPTDTPAPQAPAVTDIMVEIPAGPFTVGSDEGDPEDSPAREVDLPAFEIDRFEVTNADFAAFAQDTGYVTFAEEQGFSSWRDEWGIGEENHPVVMVTWDDAMAYCEWLGKRLPGEAEWEKAARGTDGRVFPWGNEWDPNRANVKERGLRGTAAVGSFGAGASPYGVDDMVGNVWEWTGDWYQPYPGNAVADPYYGEKFRVTRGGGWFDEEAQATAFNRNAADPTKTANDDLGFRCAR